MEGARLRTPPPEELRLYNLVRLTGWTFDEIEAAGAVRCDYLLAIADIDADVAAKKRARAAKAAGV